MSMLGWAGQGLTGRSSGRWLAALAALAALVQRALLAALALLALGLGTAAQALPAPPDDTVYGNASTALYTINTSTGVATSVGTLSFATNGIARDPVTGRVYYAEATATGRVAYFDPTTGTNTILGTALGFSTNRLAFRADGLMFSMNPSTNNIYVIDKNSGNPIIVATVQSVPLNGGGDMAFAPNGDLYIVTGTQLFRMLQNPIQVPPSGAVPSIPVTTVNTTPGNANSITGLLFVSNTRLLGSPGATNAIVDLALSGGNSNGLGSVILSDLGGHTKFADLVLSASASSSSIARSGVASYNITVANNGPQSASGNFSVKFTLPAGLSLVGAGPFGNGWSCISGTPVVCTNATASLVAGASLPLLGVPVSTAISAGVNSISAIFTVNSTTFEADASNNSATVTSSVGAATISKAFLASPIGPGGVSTLMFTLSNPTAGALTGMAFTDTLPTSPGAMVVASPPNASSSGCGSPTFAPAAGAASLSFSAGSLAAGASCMVQVDVTAPLPGLYNNTSSGIATTQTGAAAGAVSNTAALRVMAPATIVKAFATSPVIPNGPSTLSLTLSNPAANGANAINGAGFSDTFPITPGAMVLADTTITNSCGGTLTDLGGAALAAGSTGIKLSGGKVPGNGGSCVVTVRARAATSGTYNNTSSAVVSANAGTGTVSNTASLVVSSVVAPSISKDFLPSPISVNASSTLTFTITNPNPTTALSGVAFSDVFPTNPGAMTVAAVPAASTNGCGTPTFAPLANAASVAFSAGTIAGGGTCVVKVDVKLNAVGAYLNTTGAVSATGPSALTGNTASAVLATLAPPVLAKIFSPATIGTNAVSTVTIQISNPNGNQAVTGVSLTDVLPTTPGAMKVAAVPAASVSGCGAPSFAPVAGAASVAFSGGSIAGGGLCTISFNITAPTAGSYTNSTGTLATGNAGSGVADTAVLTVVATAPASITKTFLSKPMATNVPATLRFVLTNPNNATALSGVAFSDSLPASPGAMLVAPTPAATVSGCGSPTFAPLAGAASLAFSGGSIPANGSCTVTVQVVAAVAGTYANTTSAITSATPATSGAAGLDNVDVLLPPALSKTFVTNPVAPGVPTTLRFTLSNPNGSALSNLVFTDVLPTAPAAMVVAPQPNASLSAGCTGASFSPTAGAAALSFAQASLAAGATCTVSVDVVVPMAGSYNNLSQAPSASDGGSGTAASATLTAVALQAPTLSKSFASAGPVSPNTPNQTTLTLGNGNASAITLAGDFIDSLPANLTVASPAASVGSCPGVVATPGSSQIVMSGGSAIAPGGCTIKVNLMASTGGSFTNLVPAGGLATSAGSNASPASASFTVPSAPTALKSFTPATIAAGASAVLTIRLSNPNGALAITGAAFTDTYPAGLVNSATPAAALSGAGCSGSVSAAANGNSLSLTGGSIAAGASCDVTVNVTSVTPGGYLNSSGPVSTSNVGSGNASSATLTVAVGSPLAVQKSFTPATVAPGGSAVLKIRLSNPNGVAVTGASFNDVFPAGLVNTAAPAGVISGVGCSGSVTAAVNGSALALSAGTIPAGGACEVTVNVSSATPGSYLNDSGAVGSSNNGSAAGSTATLLVLSPPLVAKSFGPATVSAGSVSVLKITLSNPNAGTAITGLAFSDGYPAGLVNTASPAATLSGAGCTGTLTGAANGTALTLTGGSVPAGGSCDASVNVSSAAAGSYINTSGAVSSANAGSGTPSLATLTVLSGAVPLVAAKQFLPASIGAGDSTVLRITLSNSNGVAVTGVAFSDSYPVGLVNTGTPAGVISGVGCSGSVVATAGGAALALSGGSVPAGGSCLITANVTSASSASYVNNSGVITAANAASTGSVSGALTVLSKLVVAKAFSPASVAPNAASLLQITLSNPNFVAVTGVSLSDNYPSGLVNTGTPLGSLTGAGCSGTVTANAGGAALSLTGATLPASGSCVLSANVSSATPGSYANTTGAVATANAGSAAAASATLTVAAVINAPGISKSFSPPTVNIGFASTLLITLSNPNASAIAAVAFDDNYPTGLLNTATPGVVNGCGGALSGGAANGSSIGLSGVTLAAGASCSVSIKLAAASVGSYANTTSAVSTTNGGNTVSGGTASSTLTVTSPAPPFLEKSFSPALVALGQASTLTLKITNPNLSAVLDGVAFSDSYPPGLVNATLPNVSNSCGGAVVGGIAGGTSIGLAAGSIAAAAVCTLSVNVIAAAPGNYANTTGAVTSTTPGVISGNTASATLTVAAKPTVSKAFASAQIGLGEQTTLTLTISNTNSGTALSGLALSDNFPANLLIASAPALANSCGGTVSAAPASGLLTLSGGNLAAGGNCSLSVAVTSAVAGVYSNTASGAASNESGSAGAPSNTASLTVLLKPGLVAAFTPASTTTSGVATLSLVLSNPNGQPLSAAALTDSFPANLKVAALPNASSTCGGSLNAIAGSAAITLSGGSIPANGSCRVQLDVASAVVGSYANIAGGIATLETGAAGAPSNSVTLTVTAAASGVQVSGWIYSDVNHNLQRDASEAGTGLILFAKLVPTGTPAGPALLVVSVDAGSGLYLFSNVATGSYRVVIADNASLGDVTPARPPGWTGTEHADLIGRNLVVAGQDLLAMNFGLFNGNTLAGRVFVDNGAGAGVANNGVADGAEPGLAGVSLRLTDSSGSVVYATAQTDAQGAYLLWVSAAQAGSALKLIETNPTGYRSTGGSGAPYDRATDALSINYSPGVDQNNLNFADVPLAILSGDGQQSAAPGRVLFYAHSFNPGSAGSVSFSSSSSQGWPQLLLRDSNCNGVLDAGEPVLSGPQAVTAGTPLCLVLKVSVPGGAGFGVQDRATLQADFSYTGASPALNASLSNSDLSTVGAASASALSLLKSQDNAQPSPGSVIGYTIAYANTGSGPISTLRINDGTPAFTSFVSAACGPLPGGISACVVNLKPTVGATGAIEWTFAGSLLPGAAGQVVFSVRVD